MSVRTFTNRLDDSSARLSARVQSRVLAPASHDEMPADAGMSTAEYAIGTVAACGFAGLLIAFIKSGGVGNLLHDVIFNSIQGFLKIKF